MTTFEPCIRILKDNGYAKVYIRVIHNQKPAYISTSYVVSANQVSGNKIKDFFVITEIAPIIKKYFDRLNKHDTENWTIKEVLDFLKVENQEISFTDFFKSFTNKMINAGRENPAQNYTCAINSLTRFCGKDKINFSEITSKLLNEWIESLKDTARAKNLYPLCVSTVFSAGLLEYNDYDRDNIRIKNLPFMRVKIPKNNLAEKRAVNHRTLLKLFTADVSKAKLDVKTPLAQDVAMLIFCLAGINVADLYYMDKSCRVGNKLHYIRHKVKAKRGKSAKMEITIPKCILPLFDKYKGASKLFSFSDKVNSENNFLKAIDMGLKEVATIAKVKENITTYTFRHSWATIAQNDCKASTELVGFALNHVSAHRITDGYIKKDFSPIDKLNTKVIDHVFKKVKVTELVA
ncbi:MAG: phage integrase SAM-like domain-containing protein [Paludibacter sp.]